MTLSENPAFTSKSVLHSQKKTSLNRLEHSLFMGLHCTFQSLEPFIFPLHALGCTHLNRNYYSHQVVLVTASHTEWEQNSLTILKFPYSFKDFY